MSLASPLALLLAVPLLALLLRAGRVNGPAFALRLVLVLLGVAALARPLVQLERGGSDVIFVVDRSRSMPPGSQVQVEELIRLAGAQRGPEDRLGVISFGREARVDLPLSQQGTFPGFQLQLDDTASNLAAALEAANELLPAGRKGRVVVVSDGKASGADVRAAARRLASRGANVDFRWIGREDAALDVAVTGLLLPSAVAAHEPFQLQASVSASAPTPVTVGLFRDGKLLARTTRALPAGSTVLTFRDLLEKPGLAAYQLQVQAAGDGVAENDVGRGVLRVEGPPTVLVVTDKPAGTLVRALTQAKLNVVVRAPGPLDLATLEGVTALVLEDVDASRLTEGGLRAIAAYVRELGGGLLMTGGRHAFGEGGYRKSPVEDVLPVTLEVREEQRKAAIALSVIMDCSCSMGAKIADGRTKMELAAEGVVGALQLLDERDEASVTMVDTGPHTIFSMSAVKNGLPLNAVAKGFSGGGGILVGVGLREGKKEILRSKLSTRHVLLFADASDSTDPDDYQRTLAQLRAEKVSVSVIGMGRPTDSDAALLREVATRGEGRIYFAEDVTSLPRIFSQETIAVARSTFVDEQTKVVLGGDVTLLGQLPAGASTTIGGYNLTYLRPQANVGLKADDENKAPLLAFAPHGAGRAAALTFEVDGETSGAFRGWVAQRAVLEQAVRWVLPPVGQERDGVVRATLVGNTARITLDFPADRPPPAGTPTVLMLQGDVQAKPVELAMHWMDEDRVGADFVLPGPGTWHPVVKLDGRVFRAPPVTLPWAPEFDPIPKKEGQGTLASMAQAGQGVERLSMVKLFDSAAKSSSQLELAPWLVAAMVLGLIAEVILRRFFSERRSRTVAPRPRPSAPPFAIAGAVGTAGSVAREAPPRPSGPPSGSSSAPEPPPSAPTKPPQDMSSALAQARDRAKKRTTRGG